MYAVRCEMQRLPVQPSIVCFERYPEIIELLRQGKIACTISGDLQEQGRLAMRFLFEYIIYDRTPECSTVYTQKRNHHCGKCVKFFGSPSGHFS